MFYLKLRAAVRSLSRSGIFALINIFGLATAIGAILGIYSYSSSELAVDSHITQAKNLYRVIRSVKEANAAYATPTLAGPYDEIFSNELGIPSKDIVRVYKDDELVSYKEAVFFESNVLYVDPNFFQFFDVPFKFGNVETALNATNGVVLSEAMAYKYFGARNPIGEILEIDEKGPLEVSGVLAKSFTKSHLELEFVVNNAAMGYSRKFLMEKEAHAMTFYLRLPAERKTFVEAELGALSERHLNASEDNPKSSLYLEALPDIYFGEALISDFAQHGNRSLLYLLIVISIILSLLVTSNFVNSTIAKLTKGVQQIGVKKILGSSNKALIFDWAFETYLTVFIATGFGLLGIYLILPYIIQSNNQNLFLPHPLQLTLLGLAFSILFTLLIVAIPSLLFSNIPSNAALKGKLGRIKTNTIQEGLLLFQFIVAFVLIVFTVVINRQFQYMQDKAIGLNDNQVLIFNSNNKHSWKNRTYIKEEIQQLSGVKDVSMVYSGLPKSPTEAASYQIGQSNFQWNTAFAQANLIEVLDLKVLDGKGFDKKLKAATETGVLLNESAAMALGWPQVQIIGQEILLKEEASKKRILGVVQDYHYESFKNKIEPLVLQSTGWEETFVVKLEGQAYQNVLGEIEKIWQNYVPKYPFAYYFLDETFQNMHREDTRQGEIIFLFTILTILIASIGTLSLSAFIQELKVKEVAIKKILGASTTAIFYTLSSNILRSLLRSSLIAIPIAWFFTQQWLSDFNYRIVLSPMLFLFGLSIFLVLTLLLVFVQSYRSIRANPVKSLKES